MPATYCALVTTDHGQRTTDNGLRTTNNRLAQVGTYLAQSMPWLAEHLLTIAVLLPLAGAVIIALLSRERAQQIRWVALVASLLTFIVTVVLYAGLRGDTPGMQFTEFRPWIAVPAINYHLGVDGTR